MPEKYNTIKFESGKVAKIVFSRPEKHNAFNEEMQIELTECLKKASVSSEVRAVLLSGEGQSFCAGGDIEWMKRMASYTSDERIRDADRMAEMYETIHKCPKVTIARVHGFALGGGSGIVAACNIAVAAENAVFGFTESKIGIIPAVISPYVVEKIGLAKARELFILGERFDGKRASAIGLVSHAVPLEELDAAVDRMVKQVLSSAPGTVVKCRELLDGIAKRSGEERRKFSVNMIASLWDSDEGKEGIKAFLEKRKPYWCEK